MTELNDINVLVVVPRWRSGSGGVANYYRVISTGNDFSRSYFEVSSGTESAPRFIKALKVFGDAWRFGRRLVRCRPSVVHLNPSLESNALLRDALLLLIAKLFGRRVLIFWRGWNPEVDRSLTGLRGKLFRMVFDKADRHLVLAIAFRDRLRQLGVRSPVDIETTVVPDLWFSKFKSKKHFSAHPGLNVLFLSRLETSKGVDHAIDAVQAIGSRLSVQLMIAGDGTALGRMKLKAEGLPNVKFVGNLGGSRKAAAFRWADLYIFPSSHGEGMPNSVLEAMAAGCPIIATRVGGMADFFVEPEMGAVLTTAGSVELVEAIDRLVSRRAAWSQISSYNQDYAKARFRASLVRQRLFGIYRRVSSCC